MSKFLNRIAPQDEVLLETDIGTMIPSAEQLAEERVTRFNADKGDPPPCQSVRGHR